MESSNVQAAKACVSNVQRQLAIALFCAGLIGCAHLGWSKTDRSNVPSLEGAIVTTIAAIKQTPTVNAIVYLKGRVGNRAPLLGKTAYELQDTTGSVWVLATEPIPKVGDEVVIQGKLLYQSILLNGKEEGSVYVEQQRVEGSGG